LPCLSNALPALVRPTLSITFPALDNSSKENVANGDKLTHPNGIKLTHPYHVFQKFYWKVGDDQSGNEDGNKDFIQTWKERQKHC